MCEFSAYVAFHKATDRQTDYKTRKRLNTSLNVTVEDGVEKLPPSQRLSMVLETMVLTDSFFFLQQKIRYIIVESRDEVIMTWTVQTGWCIMPSERSRIPVVFWSNLSILHILSCFGRILVFYTFCRVLVEFMYFTQSVVFWSNLSILHILVFIALI